MGIQYRQEDTVGICGAVAGCASEAVSANAIARQCVAGGTAGVATPAMGTDAGNAVWGIDQICMVFEMVPVTGDNWNAGLYTVPINVTGAQALLRWEKTYICRLNSACTSQETLGTLTPAPILMSPTGVKTMQVNGSAVASPAAGDKILVVCQFSSLLVGATCNMRPDQLITTPLTSGTFTICDPGRMILGGLPLTSTLFPRVRPPRPEVPLDIVIP